MKKITLTAREHLAEAAARLRQARNVVALTGAGISVESGIDDFRSPGGLWSRFPPDEYATLDVLKKNPEKAWRLYRSLGKGLVGKKPNGAHMVLAKLEQRGLLSGIVTQNIDNLHQDSGSRVVLEIHGDHKHLQCLGCGELSTFEVKLLEEDTVPRCVHCNTPLKPNVVLFGENVRHFEEINNLLHRCDVLLVIGTSAQVYPAASLPEQVKGAGGLIYEFNFSETTLTKGDNYLRAGSDYFFQGRASVMLQLFLESLEAR